MAYQIRPLSERLFYIRWFYSPEMGAADEEAFIAEMIVHLEAAQNLIYFLSDLRQGRIQNPDILTELARIMIHPNWGGGVAFSHLAEYTNLVSVFANFVPSRFYVVESATRAIAFLEELSPTLTHNIDWTFLNPHD